MAAGLCRWLRWGEEPLTSDRRLLLIDSFERIRLDERSSNPSCGAAEARFFYADGDSEVRDYFSRFPGVDVVTGWLPDALEEADLDSVAFLHVDLNHAGSEIASLEALRPRMRAGAIVLFDDSGNPGCGDQLAAHQRWTAEQRAPLLELSTGQSLCILP